MKTKHTYRHALPGGIEATRETSANYAHVVVVREAGTVGVWRWSATHAGAVAYAASLQRKGFDATVEEINNGVRS